MGASRSESCSPRPEILLFDWRPGEMALGALVGTCAWGALYYFTESGKLVPRGALQDAPHNMQVERREFDQFVPGNLFGVAAASLAAYVQIQRWESENGRRVLYDPEATEPRPLAGPPL